MDLLTDGLGGEGMKVAVESFGEVDVVCFVREVELESLEAILEVDTVGENVVTDGFG